MIVKGRRVEMLCDREEADFFAPVGEQFIVLLRDERRQLTKSVLFILAPEDAPSCDAPLSAAKSDA